MWGLLDIVSFMAVTGLKVDIWLVKTVSALLVAVSLNWLYALFTGKTEQGTVILAGSTSLALLCIELYYGLNDVISPVYLADALLQFIFLGIWSWALISKSFLSYPIHHK